MNRLARKCINVSKSLLHWSKWKQGDLTKPFTKEYETLYLHFGQNIKVVKLVLQIAGSLVGLEDRITSHIKALSKFQILWTGVFSTSVEEIMSRADKISYFSLLSKEQKEQIISSVTTLDVKYLERELISLQILSKEVDAIKDITIIESLAIESLELKRVFKKKLNDAIEVVSGALVQFATYHLKSLQTSLNSSLDFLRMEMVSIDDLQYVMSVLSDLRKLEATIDIQMLPMIESKDVLEHLRLPEFTKVDNLLRKTESLWQRVQNVSEETVENLSKIQAKYKQNLYQNIKNLKTESLKFEISWKKEGPTVGASEPKLALSRLINFRAMYDALDKKIESAQKGQRLFGLDIFRPTNFYDIGKVIVVLESLLNIWQILDQTLVKFENTRWDEINLNFMVTQIAKIRKDLNSIAEDARIYQYM